MKILAPVNNLESAFHQIESGADELYIGLNDDVFNRFSFTGRGKTTHKTDLVLPGRAELAEIVSEAHKRNVKICFAANTMFLCNDVDNGCRWEKRFLNYVENGLNAGVDAIILGDLGALLLLHHEGFSIDIIAGSFFESLNIEQLKLLKELGVSRVVLSYLVTLEEIRQLTQARILDIEIFGHYGCSFHDGCCNLKHDAGESSCDSSFDLGTPCRNLYNVYWNAGELEASAFLDASLTCSICRLKDLLTIGVCSIKIVGRTQPGLKTAIITRVYKDCLDAVSKGYSNEYVMHNLLPNWWKIGFCRPKRCKYTKNTITSAFIGIA